MILYEYEGKDLLKKAGISVPQSQLVTEETNLEISRFTRNDSGGMVLKAQVLSGKRADAGGIVMVDSIKDLGFRIKELLGKVINNEKVEKVLVEERVEIEKEYYVSLSYDTQTRGPLLTISEEGGTGIEARSTSSGQARKVHSFSLNPLNPIENLPGIIDLELLKKLVSLFFDEDCLLLEINPLVKTTGGEWVALDAKVKLDDDAKGRHEDWDFPPRGVPGRLPTEREVAAKKIDEGDYRGVAGSTFFDLDGDIAIMASGGGISLTGMDALLRYGVRAANFTEYSGNPPKEKVTKLTKIVLDKPNIHGLWVIGTVAANFTDIYETLSGLIEGLRQAQTELQKEFDFPIVIRRGGPREKESFEMLSKVKDFNLILQGEETSVEESAKIMARLAQEYAATS